MLQVWLVLIAIWAGYLATKSTRPDWSGALVIGSFLAVAMSIILFFVNGGTTG